MYKDEMTPKERMTAFAKGEPMDRLPCVLNAGVTMSSIIGATCKQYVFDPDVMVETETAMFNRYRHDSVGISITLRGMAEAMGSVMNYPEDNISLLEKPVVEKPEDVDNLTIVDAHKDGKLPLVLDALQRLRDRIGKEGNVGAGMAGPFSVAASVVGTENLLRWMVKKPEVLHKVMDMVTLCNEQYIKAVGELGFKGVSFSDPVSSTSLLKVKQFKEFSLPYLTRNIAHVKQYCGSKPMVHICGTSKALWRDCVEAGIGTFSLDNIEDLAEAKEIMGKDVVITGNVPPVDVMLYGDREMIRKSVRECIRKAWNSPKGYILSTGCQIPKGTSLENLEYFMEAGREYGHFPLDFDKLNED